MSLHQKIKEDMKDAMRAKESDKVTVLRGLMSACTNELVAQKKTPQDMLDDEAVLAVISREAKRRKDAINQFTDGGRPELAEDEQKELAILEVYLPEMMSREDILPLATAKKEELGMTDKADMGKLIGALMADLKGQADGGDVKDVVSSLFNDA